MQSSSRAPLLSATLSLVSCWIMLRASPRQDPRDRRRPMRTRRAAPQVPQTSRREGGFWKGGPAPTCTSPRLLDHFDDAPALLLRQRAGLHDPDQVAHLALVALVVGLEARAVLDHLLVERVALAVGDLHHHGLVHPVGDHPAEADLAEGARRRRLLLLRLSHRLPHPVAVGRSSSASEVRERAPARPSRRAARAPPPPPGRSPRPRVSPRRSPAPWAASPAPPRPPPARTRPRPGGGRARP